MYFIYEFRVSRLKSKFWACRNVILDNKFYYFSMWATNRRWWRNAVASVVVMATKNWGQPSDHHTTTTYLQFRSFARDHSHYVQGPFLQDHSFYVYLCIPTRALSSFKSGSNHSYIHSFIRPLIHSSSHSWLSSCFPLLSPFFLSTSVLACLLLLLSFPSHGERLLISPAFCLPTTTVTFPRAILLKNCSYLFAHCSSIHFSLEELH